MQLERDFQKRAEEAANQDDDEESNDLDNESAQRVQGLLRMAVSQERMVQANQQPPILSRTNTGNQSMRGGLSLQPISSQIQSTTSSHSHTLPNQATSQNVAMSGSGQENSSLHLQPSQQQQQTASQSNEEQQQIHMSSNYGTPMSHFSAGQKPYSVGMSHSSEDREVQRRMDEVKRKQAEYEENQKKQEEELRQHQLHSQQQTYQQSQHPRSQQPLHPSMLRLDNLIINGPNVSMRK